MSDICAEYSEPKGCYDSFYKITGEGKTDARLDTAAHYLKELIVVTRDGFSGVNSKLERIDSKLERIDSKLERIDSKLDGIDSQARHDNRGSSRPGGRPEGSGGEV